ncbi:hypothetical protein FRX31_020785 [Thalictrum thalictroides]|uniref:Uncharacterized protein n=1 Tax=Thalictrum thalictroides TaxID=46969 RepID=A0A7J6VZL5_THATH|nr:hypothetical protein FRX31_020785 [Thalictrum thalictroides]
MKLFTSNQERSKGARFFRCESQPFCNGFEWFDAAMKKKEDVAMKKKEKQEKSTNATGSTLKLRIEGKVTMTIEGNAKDMADLIKKLQDM